MPVLVGEREEGVAHPSSSHSPRSAIPKSGVPGTTVAVEDLRGLLADEAAEVRWSAALVLGDMSPDARVALGDLQRLLRDEDEFVRECAALSIRKLRSE